MRFDVWSDFLVVRTTKAYQNTHTHKHTWNNVHICWHTFVSFLHILPCCQLFWWRSFIFLGASLLLKFKSTSDNISVARHWIVLYWSEWMWCPPFDLYIFTIVYNSSRYQINDKIEGTSWSEKKLVILVWIRHSPAQHSQMFVQLGAIHDTPLMKPVNSPPERLGKRKQLMEETQYYSCISNPQRTTNNSNNNNNNNSNNNNNNNNNKKQQKTTKTTKTTKKPQHMTFFHKIVDCQVFLIVNGLQFIVSNQGIPLCVTISLSIGCSDMVTC